MNRRGQATVELALGLTLLVPVLLFGLHFAELGWLSLKAHEAAASALWDSTGLRSHDLTAVEPSRRFFAGDRLLDEHGRDPAARATWLYRDFDGASGGGRAAVRLTQTSATSLEVHCESAALAVRSTQVRAAFPPARSGDRDVDALACSSSAHARAEGLTSPALTLCGVGLPGPDGTCRDRLLATVDDWALQGRAARYGHELSQCTLGHCENVALRDTVFRLQAASGGSHGTAASRLADFTVRAGAPILEGELFFSFRGEEDERDDGTPPFMEATGAEDATVEQRPTMWATSPFTEPYAAAWEGRDQCFLGQRCDRPLF